MLVLLKNHLNYCKDSIFKCFLRGIIDVVFVLKFSQHIMMESLSLEDENIIKDIGNLFRLEKGLKYTAIKDIRNLFRLEKQTKAI